ncbi:hypothetical protein DEU56DRAFT_754444 [Suillus clintonianus]|uniref:uncharacterized protein n=1 Tax=Suillus clintonianus TaxID=1904413 RepID=UPI001B884981|nr:uncharacterized protein DEU56DRAFT_754444 [Suillus clintonianus]KAG2143637.1 hypothetical protein DEU56DRAFT_754444 [Suillus clintonianus]
MFLLGSCRPVRIAGVSHFDSLRQPSRFATVLPVRFLRPSTQAHVDYHELDGHASHKFDRHLDAGRVGARRFGIHQMKKLPVNAYVARIAGPQDSWQTDQLDN